MNKMGSSQNITTNNNSKWMMSFFEDNLLEEEEEEVAQPAVNSFFWCPQPTQDNPDCSMDNECCNMDGDEQGKSNSKKRMRDESCGRSGSKACREKKRRDRLNDRFQELGALLDPGKPPKTDKIAILADALRALNQLKAEAQQLRESNQQLENGIKELKTEKNELREEKQRLKTEKERVEQQVKAASFPSPYLSHSAAAMHAASLAAFAAHSQLSSNKVAAPVPGYPSPSVGMWQWMPPSSVDTSQDHLLRPPVA